MVQLLFEPFFRNTHKNIMTCILETLNIQVHNSILLLTYHPLLVLFLLATAFFSLFVGNLFVFFKFQGLEHIGESTRRIVILVLSGIGAVGIVVFICLPPIRRDDFEEDAIEEIHLGPIDTLKGAGKLFITKRMLLLAVTFFYTGNIICIFAKHSISGIIVFVQVLN